MPNRLEKYMCFNISNNLMFIDNFPFCSSSLESLVENLSKNDFKYLHQEFDSKVLYLVKQKGFCSNEYISDFEKFLEKLPCNKRFDSSLTCKKN